MMDLLQAVILAVVEGVTEFLPISSTGHLILTSKLLNIPQTEFVKSFEIIIQSGAIVAVLVLYGKKLLENLELFKKVSIAFLPTGITGLLLYSTIRKLFDNPLVTVIALIVGGVIIILIELYFKNKPKAAEISDLSYKKAFMVGVIQSLSMIPGVSRAAATIIGGMVLGLKRQAAVELSFLLAIPTMFVATGYDLYKNYHSLDLSQLQTLIVGFVASFIVALLVVRWFLGFVKKYDFIPFGIYRVVVGIIFLLIIL